MRAQPDDQQRDTRACHGQPVRQLLPSGRLRLRGPSGGGRAAEPPLCWLVEATPQNPPPCWLAGATPQNPQNPPAGRPVGGPGASPANFPAPSRRGVPHRRTRAARPCHDVRIRDVRMSCSAIACLPGPVRLATADGPLESVLSRPIRKRWSRGSWAVAPAFRAQGGTSSRPSELPGLEV